MHQPFSLPAGNRVNNRRQAYALLLLGVIFLFIALLGFLNPYALGVLLLGLGMLGVAPLNPRRYLSAGWLTTSLGVATFLMFRKYIPDSQILTAHLLAIGLGLIGIAWMAQRGDDGLALAFALIAHPQLFQACCGFVSSGFCWWIRLATCSHIICHCWRT